MTLRSATPRILRFDADGLTDVGCDPRVGAFGELSLHAAGSFGGGLVAQPLPVGLKLPAVGLVGEAAIEDVDYLGADPLVLNRHHQLHAVVEVAWHEVC